MRNNIIYILACILIGFLSSCIQEEQYLPDDKAEHNSMVHLSAFLKGYTKANVATRAAEGGFDSEVFENTIYNAYFLLFDNMDILRVKGKATIDEEGAVSYNIGRDVLSVYENFKICFLANVSQSIVDGFTLNDMTWDDLDDYYLSIDYARYSEVGCAGVPGKADINGDGQQEYAMPMFGYKEVSRPYNPSTDYTISLERLFAKIEMNVALGIQDDNNIFSSEPQFSLMDCEIVNIPKKAPIVKKNAATKYSADTNNSNFTSEEIDSYTDFEYIIYSSPVNNPKYKSIYFYIPEHRLNLPASPGTAPAQKPTLVDGKNLRPVLAKISGFLTDRGGKTYDAVYSIYLGESNNDNFDLARNTKYINYVRLNGVSDPNVDHRVEIEEMDEMVDNLVDEKGQTANCYIIENNGRYMLPAYKGAYQLPDGNAKLCETGTNEVLYCDNPNITITIDDRLSKQSTIVFTVTGITEEGNEQDTSPETGNAIIVRYNDSGEIEWSWHLWFVGNNKFTFVGDVDFGTWTSSIVKSEALPDNKSLMDRNIGTHSTVWTANADVDLGLYYQYGKKEPFLGGSYKGGGTLEGDTSWNRADNKKSPTDPCPVGYRVPNASVYEQSATKEHYSGELYRRWTLPNVPPPVEEKTDVTVFRYWYTREVIQNTDNDIFFPYSGYLDASGNKQNGTGLDKTATTLDANDCTIMVQTDEKPVGEPSGGNLALIQYQNFSSIEYEYTQFKYSLKLDISHCGYLWCLDKNYLYYSYGNTKNCDGLQIVSCMYRTREATHRKKRTRWSVWSDWGPWESSILDFNQGDWGAYNEIKSNQNNVVIEKDKTGSINNVNWQNALKSNEANRNIASAAPVAFTTVPSEGYQVRCIRE